LTLSAALAESSSLFPLLLWLFRLILSFLLLLRNLHPSFALLV
jgi:hypothetical protein